MGSRHVSDISKNVTTVRSCLSRRGVFRRLRVLLLGRVGARRRLASVALRGVRYTVSPLEWLYEKEAGSATLPVLLALAKAVGILHANRPAATSVLTHRIGAWLQPREA